MSTKTYDRQSGKFIARIAENLPEMPDDIMQGWIDDPKALQNFLKGLVPTTNGDKVSDSIIRINRSVKPTYPDWVVKVLHPELEMTGPAEYNAAKLEQWLHDDQKDGGWIRGQKIYEHLKNNNMLESCIGLADLLAIQAKGIYFFRKHFAGKMVFGWKSVVRSRFGNLRAPCLCESGDEVYLHWRGLEGAWGGLGPALRLAS